MCWCNPSIRTPHCGAIDCHPPIAVPVVGVGLVAGTGKSASELLADMTAAIQDVSNRMQVLMDKAATAKAAQDELALLRQGFENAIAQLRGIGL